MFYVFQIVCKGKVCEAILYSLQTFRFQSSKAYFWGKQIFLRTLNAKCKKKKKKGSMIFDDIGCCFLNGISLSHGSGHTFAESGFRMVTTRIIHVYEWMSECVRERIKEIVNMWWRV